MNVRKMTFAAVALLLAALPSDATAGARFQLAAGESPDLTVDSAGAAHVVWREGADIPRYCRVDRGTAGCAVGTLATLSFPFPPSELSERWDPSIQRASDGVLYVSIARANADDIWIARSTDGGATWSTGAKIHSGAVGAFRARPLLDEPSGKLILVSTGSDIGHALGAKLDGSESGSTAAATLAAEGLQAPTLARHADGSLVGAALKTTVVGNEIHSWSTPPGGDPSATASWSPPRLVGEGSVPSLAGTSAGTVVAYDNDGLAVRRFDGTGFGPESLVEPGFVSVPSATSALSGALGVAYRLASARGEDSVRLALSGDGGASFSKATIATGSESFHGLELALGPDNAGFVAWYDEDRVFMADTSTVPDPVFVPPPPYSGRLLSGRLTIPGGTLRMRIPARCVKDGQRYKTFIDVRRKRGSRGRPRITRADFYLNGKRVRRDRRAPFVASHTAVAGASANSFVLAHRVVVKVRTGRRTVTREFDARMSICTR